MSLWTSVIAAPCLVAWVSVWMRGNVFEMLASASRNYLKARETSAQCFMSVTVNPVIWQCFSFSTHSLASVWKGCYEPLDQDRPRLSLSFSQQLSDFKVSGRVLSLWVGDSCSVQSQLGQFVAHQFSKHQDSWVFRIAGTVVRISDWNPQTYYPGCIKETALFADLPSTCISWRWSVCRMPMGTVFVLYAWIVTVYSIV